MGLFSLGALARQARRYIAVLLAILIGVAFVTATMTLGDSMKQSIEDRVAGRMRAYDVIVLSGSDSRWSSLQSSDAQAVAGVSGVQELHKEFSEWNTVGVKGEYPAVLSLPRDEAGLALSEGRWPSAAGEVVITTNLATGAELRVGDSFPVGNGSSTAGLPGEAETGKDTAAKATVVGLTDAQGGGMAIYAQPRDIETWTPYAPVTWVGLIVAPDSDAGHVAAAVQAAVPDLSVLPADEAITRAVADRTGDVDILRNLLLAFAAIALITMAMVIANTFSVLIAQRSRELALSRCVGATKQQVWRSVIVESLVIGVVGSVIGVLAGLGLMRAVVAYAANRDIGLTSFGIAPSSLIVPVIVGVVMTLLSALVPARRATRVAPLAALRPEPASFGARANVARIIFGGLFFLGGLALMFLGGFMMDPGEGATGQEQMMPLLVAIAGGLLAVIGGLMLAVIYVPVTARLLGALPAKAMGVPGDLAVMNVRRHPGRAAATASALLIGAGLMSMMAVTSDTVRSTVLTSMNEGFPVDVTVEGTTAEADLGAKDVIQRVRSVEGIDVAVPVLSGTVYAEVGGGMGSSVRVYGASPEVGAVIRDEKAARAAADVRPDQLLISEVTAKNMQMGGMEGATLTIKPYTTSGARGKGRQVRVVFANVPAFTAMLHEDTLRELDPKAGQRTVFVKARDGVDIGAFESALRSAATIDGQEPEVQGMLKFRAELDRALDIMMLIVGGLLGVSVLIALIGIFNTMSLSVYERGRESALLRALGLTRGQLKSMLALEAVLFALVGAVLGVAFGAFCSWVGVNAAVPDTIPLSFSMPWGRIGIMLLVATVAGLLAAVVPAAIASRTSPVEALADAT